MSSNDHKPLIDSGAANLLEPHAVMVSVLVISVTSNSAIRFKAMLREVKTRSRHGDLQTIPEASILDRNQFEFRERSLENRLASVSNVEY